MQFIEQLLQNSHVPHSSIMVCTFSDFREVFRFSSFFMVINVKKGQGNATEASGFREMVLEADVHLMTLLNPPRDWNLK